MFWVETDQSVVLYVICFYPQRVHQMRILSAQRVLKRCIDMIVPARMVADKGVTWKRNWLLAGFDSMN